MLFSLGFVVSFIKCQQKPPTFAPCNTPNTVTLVNNFENYILSNNRQVKLIRLQQFATLVNAERAKKTLLTNFGHLPERFVSSRLKLKTAQKCRKFDSSVNFLLALWQKKIWILQLEPVVHWFSCKYNVPLNRYFVSLDFVEIFCRTLSQISYRVDTHDGNT